jgi:hypothetical protein
MRLDYVPLLRLQRDLHDIPRGMERFRAYLRMILNEDGTDVALPPLVLMNPMGKGHVAALLDGLLALDADRVAAGAAADASADLAGLPGDYPVALVVADDLMGGWTNRYACEFDLRFSRAPHARRFWGVMGVLWSSEAPSASSVREAVLTAAHRAGYVLRHGPAVTLRQRLAQEGHVLAAAGCAGPVLDPDDLEYTRAVIAPLLNAEDMRTAVECLFGDAAGRTLGFTPRGLSPWAGMALALHDARRDPES